MLSEIGKYVYKQQKEAERNAGSGAGTKTDVVMDDEEAWDIDLIEVREEVP